MHPTHNLNSHGRVIQLCIAGLALVFLLGAGAQGCLFLDVLTGLYTGRYQEFSACKIDEEASNCEQLSVAHDICWEEKGAYHPDCRALFGYAFDCSLCDEFFADSDNSSFSKRTAAAITTAQPEVFWSAGRQHILRTTNGGTSVTRLFDGGRWPLGVAVDPEAGKVYWTDGRTHSLRGSNLDGSDVEDLVTDLYGSGVAVDASTNALYYGSVDLGRIERLDLTTLESEIVVDSVFSPIDLAFDPQSGFIYWTRVDENDEGSIQWLDPDEGGQPVTIASGLSLPFGLTIDPAAGMLYFSEIADNAIRSLRISDATISDVLTGLDLPGGVAVDPLAGTIYWADVGVAALRRADLADPVNTTTTISGFAAVADIAVDVDGERVYWSGWLAGTMSRAGLDGSTQQVIVDSDQLQGDLALDPNRSKLYSIALTSGQIRRMNHDGSDVEDLGTVQPGLGAVAFDPSGDKLYWTTNGDVLRGDPDGTNAETIVTGVVFIGDLEIDATGGRIYWVNRESIGVSNLDGSNRGTFYTDTRLVESLAVDQGMLYWSVPFDGAIRRAAIDGSTGVEDVVTGGGLMYPIDIVDDKLYWGLPIEGIIRRANLDGSDIEVFVADAGEVEGMVADFADPVGFDGGVSGQDIARDELQISPAYPNPFSGSTRVVIAVRETQHVEVFVFDELGRMVERIHEGVLASGAEHAFTVAGDRLASGRYHVVATGEDGTRASATLVKAGG